MAVSEVVKERVEIPLNAESLSAERIAYLEGLVRQARTAAAVFTQFTQEDVDRIVKAMVLAGLEQAQHLARLAVEETRLGVMEDKVLKNMVATEFVYNYVKDKRTVGVIREISRAQSGGDRRADRSDLLAYSDYQSHFHGSLQMHHGDQDAQRGHFQSRTPRGLALLLRGREDHVRNRGEARRAGRSLLLPGDRIPCTTTPT